MADTWFVGLTGDANTIVAASLCLPVCNLMTGLSNLRHQRCQCHGPGAGGV